jgi:hypothetical protein
MPFEFHSLIGIELGVGNSEHLKTGVGKINRVVVMVLPKLYQGYQLPYVIHNNML